jgi:polysaccharide export outer membrane protein
MISVMTLRSGLSVALLLWCISMPGTAGADTLLAPSDIINVSVYGETTLTQSLTIEPDGSIVLPLIGRVVVGGLSTTQAQAAITHGLLRYVRHPIVSVALQTEAPYDVLVLGNVKTPGLYKVPPGARVTDAIAVAGGLNPIEGPYPQARVTSGSSVQAVSLEALFRSGDVTQNVPITSGSAVYVPGPVVFRVRVLGAVDHPGDVELNSGDHLAVAIAKAGNSPSMNSDLNHIRVTHTLPDGKTHVTEVNLYKALQDGDSSADIVLSTDDVVYVPESPKKTGGAAGILGALRQIFLPF